MRGAGSRALLPLRDKKKSDFVNEKYFLQKDIFFFTFTRLLVLDCLPWKET
jgi:hypothetical protein